MCSASWTTPAQNSSELKMGNDSLFFGISCFFFPYVRLSFPGEMGVYSIRSQSFFCCSNKQQLRKFYNLLYSYCSSSSAARSSGPKTRTVQCSSLFFRLLFSIFFRPFFPSASFSRRQTRILCGYRFESCANSSEQVVLMRN